MSATQTWSGRTTSRSSTRLGYRGKAGSLLVVRARRTGGGPRVAGPANRPPRGFAVAPPALAPQLGGQAAIAVGGPLPGQAPQSRPQVGLVGRGRRRRAVQQTAREVEQAADQPDRVLLGEGHDDLP